MTANNTNADSKLEHMSDTSKRDKWPLLTVKAQKASVKILVMVKIKFHAKLEQLITTESYLTF